MRRTAQRWCSARVTGDSVAAAAATVAECLRDVRQGRAVAALARLNELKAASSTELGIDYARALCFLANQSAGSVLMARQSLLEELRLHPGHRAARVLLQEVNEAARPLLAPPSVVQQAHPLFALLFDALLDATMLTWPRLLNLFHAAERVARNRADTGHLVECGSAGGGAAVLMAVVLAETEAAIGVAASSSPRRRVFALDTFAGMPPPTTEDRLARASPGALQMDPTASWGTGTCRSPAACVTALARHFSVEERLVVLEGRFEDSIPAQLLPRQDVQQDGIALLHLDADWYASTRTALRLLTPVMRGRFSDSETRTASQRVVQIDDYHYWQGCRHATDEFLAEWGTNAPALHDVDDNAVWFAVPHDDRRTSEHGALSR